MVNPNSLHAFQQSFTNYLQSPSLSARHTAALLNWLSLDTGGIANTQRLTVYRNNVHYSLAQALAAQFPSIQRLVGAAFFQQLAQVYVPHYLPTDAALTFYGAEFADWLAKQPACETAAYLADVARLEFAQQVALHAADAPLLTMNDWQQLSNTTLSDCLIRLHPSVTLICSHWPVAAIYFAQQKPEPAPLEIKAGVYCVLIYRAAASAQIVELSPTAYKLLIEWQRQPLLTAWELVQQQYELPDSELISLLAFLFNLPVISEVLANEPTV